jgi:hypothetical protein
MTRSRPTLSAARSQPRGHHTRLLLLLGLVLLPGPTWAAQAGEAERTPAHSRSRIDTLEAEGKALRAEAEATYAATLPGCSEKFLVNRCIDQAKKKRLETIQRARAIEAEARRITLTERQRAAAAAGKGSTSRPPMPAEPTPLPAAPAARSPTRSPTADAAPAPAAEHIRAQREASIREAEAQASRKRAAADAERATERRQAEEAAARRAQQAAEDRARYEERLRNYQEEQAQQKK